MLSAPVRLLSRSQCHGATIFRLLVQKLLEPAFVEAVKNEVLAEAKTANHIILDFQGVDEMTAGGFALLARLHTLNQRSETQFSFCGFNSEMRHLLRLTNLDSLFPSYATPEEVVTQ